MDFRDITQGEEAGLVGESSLEAAGEERSEDNSEMIGFTLPSSLCLCMVSFFKKIKFITLPSFLLLYPFLKFHRLYLF